MLHPVASNRCPNCGAAVSEIGAQLKLASNTVSIDWARIPEKTGATNDVEFTLFTERHARATPAKDLPPALVGPVLQGFVPTRCDLGCVVIPGTKLARILQLSKHQLNEVCHVRILLSL